MWVNLKFVDLEDNHEHIYSLAYCIIQLNTQSKLCTKDWNSTWFIVYKNSSTSESNQEIIYSIAVISEAQRNIKTKFHKDFKGYIGNEWNGTNGGGHQIIYKQIGRVVVLSVSLKTSIKVIEKKKQPRYKSF